MTAARPTAPATPITDLALLARSTAWICADPFRTHLRHLMAESGEEWPVLALAAGVPPATVRTLITEHPGRRRRIRARDAALILQLGRARITELALTQVPALDTRRRIAALSSLGCPPGWLARRLRLDVDGATRLAGAEWCSALTELRAASACRAAGLSGWWSGDAWFDDSRPARPRCTTPMPDLAA